MCGLWQWVGCITCTVWCNTCAVTSTLLKANLLLCKGVYCEVDHLYGIAAALVQCVLVSLLSHNRQYNILRSCKVGCVWQRPSCSTWTLCVNHYTNCVHSVTEVLLQAILVLHCVVYCKTGLCFELHHLPNFANCFALTQVTCKVDARRAASRSSSSSTFSHKHAT